MSYKKTGLIEDLIIEKILKEVKEKKSARVGYHAREVLNQDSVPYNVISKLEARITESGRYKSRPHPVIQNDYEIMSGLSWMERHGWFEKIVLAILGGIIALLVGYISLQFKERSQNQVDHSQDSIIQKINMRVETLQKYIENRDQHSKHEIPEDSVEATNQVQNAQNRR